MVLFSLSVFHLYIFFSLLLFSALFQLHSSFFIISLPLNKFICMLTHWKLRVSVGIKNLLSFFLFTCKTSSPPFESFIPFPFVSR
ncbi:Uncharacterized protein APZ42_025197 [Daphnia magna]|uniref:Uncharacterized protein n=1 Tax=Daphnia magna TaxID=35525 RepID=A0A164TD86_9CRUS|nr:Uncharacterized protein APZ42_025197 [Daphnia magna]